MGQPLSSLLIILLIVRPVGTENVPSAGSTELWWGENWWGSVPTLLYSHAKKGGLGAMKKQLFILQLTVCAVEILVCPVYEAHRGHSDILEIAMLVTFA